MSLFDPDDEDETQGATSPFVERTDSVAEVPEAEEPGSTPLPPAGAQDSAQDYVSAPEGSLPTAEQGPYGSYRSPVAAPAESALEDGGVDNSDWLKPIPIPEAVKFSPYKDSTADLDALKAQYAKEATENTKPSGWRRLAAGLAGGAVAYGSRNAGEGMAVANSINNAPRVNAEERWQREERPLAQQFANDQQENAAIQRQNALAQQGGVQADRQFRNQVYAQDQQGRTRNYAAMAAAKLEGVNGDGWKPDDPSNPLGSYSGVSIGGRPIHSAEPPKSVQLTSGYRRAAGTSMGLSGHELTRYALTGTLPPEKAPRQATAEDMQWGAYVRGLGHAPTPQDVINFKRGTPGDNDPETLIAKSMNAKDAFITQWRRVGKNDATELTPEGSYVSTDGSGRMISGPEFNAKVDKFRTDLNASTGMRKAGIKVDENGNTVGGSPAAQTQSVAQTAPAANQSQVKHYQGKPYTKDPKTGQWVLQQAGGGSGPPNPR